jgi:hypothetical protein
MYNMLHIYYVMCVALRHKYIHLLFACKSPVILFIILTMLTYQQYVQKHTVKFSKLSLAQKKKRYEDYRRTTAGATPNTRRITIGRNQIRGRTSTPSARTPECLKSLAALYANPFDAAVTGLPVFPSPPSQKLRIFAKGSFQSGSSGFGYVTVQPALANDAVSLYYSSPAYTGAVVSSTSGTGQNGIGVSGNCQYINSSYTTVNSANPDLTLQQRLVCAGLRIRYTGTEQNRSGTSIVFVEPEHQTTNGFSVGAVQTYEGVNLSTVSRSWQWACLTPIHRTELDYNNYPQLPSMSSNQTVASGFPICAIVSGTQPSTSFDYEYTAIYEVIGTTTAEKTENHVSPYAETFITEIRGSTANYAGGSGPSSAPPTSGTSVGSVLNSVITGIPIAINAYKAVRSLLG